MIWIDDIHWCSMMRSGNLRALIEKGTYRTPLVLFKPFDAWWYSRDIETPYTNINGFWQMRQY